MYRNVELSLDRQSWTSGTPPTELNALQGLRRVNVSKALLNLALRTRPPSSIGIDLCDYWAWLRYFPAVSSDSLLSLRDEWIDIDPHQKTILSDDWGVGFTTGIVGQLLNVGVWADTQYAIRLLGNRLGTLQSGNKHGPKKSPDFIGGRLTASPGLIALECKGTQSSRDNLDAQIESGKAQKNSLQFAQGLPVVAKLVAGLYVTNARWQDVPLLIG